MFGDTTKGGNVLPRLDGWRRSAANTYKMVNKGAHDGHPGSLRSLINDSHSLTDLISQKLA